MLQINPCYSTFFLRLNTLSTAESRIMVLAYNKIPSKPSKPSNEVFAWDIETSQWQTLNPMTKASMDHRAMIDISFYEFYFGCYFFCGHGKYSQPN